jgi:hypothetical protein
VLPCVPVLLLQLQAAPASGTSSQLSGPEHECRMQAVWALGNIAADGQESCALLWEQGVVEPLVKLFLEAAQHPDGEATASTTAWAVSNLARGNAVTAVPFVQMGTHAAVVGALGRIVASGSVASSVHLIAEVCWVLVYLTAR